MQLYIRGRIHCVGDGIFSLTLERLQQVPQDRLGVGRNLETVTSHTSHTTSDVMHVMHVIVSSFFFYYLF